MEIKSSDKLRNEIKRLYDRKPRKWHVLVGRDSKGYSSTIFMHGGRMWMIKEEPLNPFESIGCGLKIENIDESLMPFLKNPCTFGFRPISEKYLRDILDAEISDKTVEKVLKRSPIPTNRITSPTILGPVTLPTKPIDFVSGKQKKLDMELGRELDKMIYKQRPDILLPYV